MYVENKTKAVAYIRVSGAGQENGDGFTRQRIAIESFAASRGITITGWYQDVHTGKDEWQDRPGWSEMLSALNGTRTILVEKLDRVARRVLVQELIAADLQKRDVILLTSTGDDSSDDDPERVMFRQILASFAQYERASIVLKLRGARQRKKDETGRCEGRKPFGGHPNHPSEPETLAFMKAWRKDGDTLEIIADKLNTAGYRTRKGGPWIAATVCKILSREQNTDTMNPCASGSSEPTET